jgi:hypothetical protein
VIARSAHGGAHIIMKELPLAVQVYGDRGDASPTIDNKAVCYIPATSPQISYLR